jgi:hypothetical protein
VVDSNSGGVNKENPLTSRKQHSSSVNKAICRKRRGNSIMTAKKDLTAEQEVAIKNETTTKLTMLETLFRSQSKGAPWRRAGVVWLARILSPA